VEAEDEAVKWGLLEAVGCAAENGDASDGEEEVAGEEVPLPEREPRDKLTCAVLPTLPTANCGELPPTTTPAAAAPLPELRAPALVLLLLL
jgi:hypothetical protein